MHYENESSTTYRTELAMELLKRCLGPLDVQSYEWKESHHFEFSVPTSQLKVLGFSYVVVKFGIVFRSGVSLGLASARTHNNISYILYHIVISN